MKTQTYPALLAAAVAAALALAGCQRQSAEQPTQTTEPRVAQTQTAPAPVPQTTPPAAPPVASEPYVLEEQGRTTSPAPPPAAAKETPPPPAATERHDVEQPTRAVAPPATPPKPPKPQPTPKPDTDRERRLAQRERRLAQRQAALDARERRLRQQESPDRTEIPMPDQPAPADAAPAPEPETMPAPEPERARPEPVTLTAGTKLDIRFDRALSSETSTVGEIFRARVSSDIYAGDRIAIPAGSEVVGEVTQAASAKKIGGGKALLGLRVTDLVLPSGETIPLKASFQREGASRNGRDAATIGGATAGGAILGRILSKGGGKGTILGALIGAAAGAAIASKNPGEEVVIPEGSVLGIVLDRAVEVQGRR